MANPDFMKKVFKDVSFLWPRLDQPYRYNNQDKRTEACAASVQGAGYSIAWQVPLAEATEIKAELKAHFDDCRTRNSKLPEFSTVFGMNRSKDKDGNPTEFVTMTAKKRAMSNDGKENKAPGVYKIDRTELEDKAIWSGSTGHVRVLAFPTTDPDGKGGISLLLDTVMVTAAEYGGDSLDDFGDAQPVDDLPPSREEAAKAPSTGADEGGF